MKIDIKMVKAEKENRNRHMKMKWVISTQALYRHGILLITFSTFWITGNTKYIRCKV